MLIDHLDRALEEQANAHVAQIDRLSERVASVETKLEEHVMVMERFGRAVERNVRWIHPGRTDVYCYGEFERALYADVLQLVDESWMERRRPRYWDFLQEARVKRGREVAGLGVEEEGEAEEDERGGNEELVRSPGGVEENREPIGDRDGEAIQLQDEVERILGLIPDSELGPLPGEAEETTSMSKTMSRSTFRAK